MNILGYILALFSLYLLYNGIIFVGALFLFIGGIISGGFTIGISSISTLSLISFLTYGIHNEFTITIIILCLVSAILTSVSKGSGYWEIELGLFDFGSCGDGGDCGGSGGC